MTSTSEGNTVNKYKKPVLLRDSTLREGLDMPQTRLGETEKLKVFESLVNLGISSFEVVGPGNYEKGLSLLSRLECHKPIVKSGIVSVLCSDLASRLDRLVESGANHVDLLLHISEIRLKGSFLGNSASRTEKILEYFQNAFSEAKRAGCDSVGIGFGDVFRSRRKFVCSLVEHLSELSPDSFVLYDTVGIALPSEVTDLIGRLVQITSVSLHCHFHNDMGMATANTIVAIQSGASGADVTIGGIGDRSGNACLEEVALIAEYRLGRKTGVELSRLTESAQAILETFGLLDRRLRPVVGDFTFVHSTPSHFNAVLAGEINAYEPYPPELVGQIRRFQVDNSPDFALALREWTTRKGIRDPDIDSGIHHNLGQMVTEEQLAELLK